MEELFCACCNRIIGSQQVWHGNTDKLYCSSSCADSEIIDDAAAGGEAKFAVAAASA